jgi:hypothetical protein
MLCTYYSLLAIYIVYGVCVVVFINSETMKDKAIKPSLIIITFVALVVAPLMMINNLQRLKNKDHKQFYTKPVEKIILLGERHSGTNWITDYLTGCFQHENSNITVCI